MEYPDTVAKLTEILRQGGYLADRGLATALFVALSLHRPVLLEGEVGVGKTEVAKVMAEAFGRRLIRLQCYEGIDTSQALYEWDYARQMLAIRALSERQGADDEAVGKLFGPRYLLEPPLLGAGLARPPGVAETRDWARTLDFLGGDAFTAAAAADTLGAVVKARGGLELVRD